MTMINSNPILSNDNAKEWTLDAIEAIYNQAFNDLLFNAHSVHRANFDVNEVQVSSLLSIKTGACPEDCGYCSQSAKHSTELERESLLSLDEVVSAAEQAKQNGSSRFCMGAAWRNPTDKSLDKVIDMIKAVKGLGMESCVTLGMLSASQVDKLKEAGLDYYNHNLDTSPEYYPEVISTRSFQDRLDTLDNVRNAGINVCSGGIVGMGETIKDRLRLLQELANLPEAPQSVPINHLVPVQGTPLQNAEAVDPLDFVRVIATARILMPTAYVRLSAGRESMSEAIQAMCFFAGANSMFYGEQLLTTDNNPQVKDDELFVKLGINKQKMSMGHPVSV